MRAIPIDHLLNPEETGSPGGRAPDWGRFVSEGRAARAAADGGAWRIGDLALMIERRYRSGALKRFAEAIGESTGTVRRYRWVAGAYTPDARARFRELSFCHFQTVAGLKDRATWLERARRGEWSVARLTGYVREESSSPRPLEVTVRRPVESATKQIAKLASLDQRTLSRAARAGLADAVDELAEQVDRLRARLSTIERRNKNLKLASSR